ncbi:MAG: colanic acid biosynthesis acetyltransferase WcaF, partial [Sphingobacteriaceae bacterium]
MSGKTNLKRYNNQQYYPGAGWFKRVLWFYINALIFKSSAFPSSNLKVFLLRIFGAKIGKNVVIRHQVNIKYPWFLSVEDDSWIGEKVWIDNLISVQIGS